MAESLVCPNCSRKKIARYCAYCGQSHRDFRRSLPPMMFELVREAFELDGRILASLKLLFTKPGQLSVEFSNNRRAAYVSPIRFYLFASILFFFALSQLSDIDGQAPEDIQISVEELGFEAKENEVEYFRSLLTPPQLIKFQALLDREGSFARRAILAIAEAAHEEHRQGGQHGATERFLYGQFVEVLHDPQDFVDRCIENAPFSMFLLVPVYALLLKLVFLGTRKYFVEHVVFALHLHSFLFLLLTVQIFLPEEGLGGALDSLLTITFFVYYFMSLRRYYEHGVVRTGLKFVFLLLAHGIILVPAIVGTMVMTATQI